MRLGLRPLALLLFAALLCGCGSSRDESERAAAADRSAWPGPPQASANGKLPVADFNDYLAKRRRDASPATLALEFVRDDQTQAARTSVDGQATAEGGGPETVTLTLDGLADDSVRTTRYVFRFERSGEGWRLDSAVRTHRCRSGRGHEDFSARDCV